MAAPEEIGLVESPFGFRLWSRDEDDSESGAIRYVRADLLATLEAKLAEVTKERDEWEVSCRGASIAYHEQKTRRVAAEARATALEERVKALEKALIAKAKTDGFLSVEDIASVFARTPDTAEERRDG